MIDFKLPLFSAESNDRSENDFETGIKLAPTRIQLMPRSPLGL